MDLPIAVQNYNKSKKAPKITTLDRAKAAQIKRFFSGSFLIDDITGGGYAYRRIQLLFGGRSASKSAELYQMIAFNQRLCRNCFGILPQYYEMTEKDRWTSVLADILMIPPCKCSASDSKKILFLDYERALGMETPKTETVKKITNKETGEEIDELDYNTNMTILDELKLKKELTEKQKEKIDKLEKYFESLNVVKTRVERMNAKDYLINCGVIYNELMMADPSDTEEGIEIAIDLTKSMSVDAIIWDSLQSAIPRYVKDRDPGEATMGIEAKQNGLLMRHICSAFAAEDLEDEKQAYKPALFIISQVRSSIGGFHAGPDTYSGGNAIHHHIALALEFKRQCFLKENGEDAKFDEDFYGQRVRLRADKNKLSAPGDMYEYNYYFRKGEKFPIGIDHVAEIINLGISKRIGLIEQGGAWFKVRGERFQGKSALIDFMRDKPKFVGQLYQDIKNKRGF